MLVDHIGVVYPAAMRPCAKLRCEETAAASVTVRYADRTAIVEALWHERDPNLLDLCDRHASGLTAPRGWRLVDQRSGVSRQGEQVPVSA